MKLAIYIPKDLEKELKEYGDRIKERKGYSRLFTEAIRKEIAKMRQVEMSTQNETNMDEIIERLRRQKEEAMDTSYQAGYAEGESRASGMDYDELKRIGDYVQHRVYEQTGKIADGIYETLDGVGFEVHRDRLAQEHGIEDPDEYVNGLTKGIAAFWKRIEKRL